VANSKRAKKSTSFLKRYQIGTLLSFRQCKSLYVMRMNGSNYLLCCMHYLTQHQQHIRILFPHANVLSFTHDPSLMPNITPHMDRSTTTGVVSYSPLVFYYGTYGFNDFAAWSTTSPTNYSKHLPQEQKHIRLWSLISPQSDFQTKPAGLHNVGLHINGHIQLISLFYRLHHM
jgi:hypothetical protein